MIQDQNSSSEQEFGPFSQNAEEVLGLLLIPESSYSWQLCQYGSSVGSLSDTGMPPVHFSLAGLIYFL